MKPMRFIVVGSGWRSLFFARIAQAYPEWFELSALLCRTREKALERPGQVIESERQIWSV